MSSMENGRHEPLFDRDRASRLMDEAGLDVILGSRRHTVGYLSGRFAHLYWEYPEVAHCLEKEDDGCEAPYYFAAVFGDTRLSPFLVAHFNRASIWRGECWIEDVRPCCEKPGKLGAVEQIASGIEERGLGRGTIGVEMNHLPAGIMRELQSRLPNATFKDATPVIWQMRMVKTERELARQREAYRIAAGIYQEVFRAIAQRPGITVGEVRGLEMALAVEAGCPPPHFGYVFPQDDKEKLPWRTGDPGVRIERGDVVMFDLGIVHTGYTTDFGRNVSVGPPAVEVREMYQKTLELRHAVASAIRPGARACDVHRTGTDFWKNLTGEQARFLGHGLGIECHEPPVLRADDETPIEEGMTIVIELVTGVGEIRFLVEDGGVVTNKGWESLTTMSPELVEV